MENRNDIFNSFIRKANERLEDKKKPKYMHLYVPCIDEEIKIRSLTKAEVDECFSMEGDAGDDYMLYLCCVEPSLKETAKVLKSEGKIQEYTEVVNIFNAQEKSEILRKILNLSDVTTDKHIEVIDDIKN